MPLEFAQANAPMRTELLIEVWTSFALSHSAVLSAFFSGTTLGIKTTLSVAKE